MSEPIPPAVEAFIQRWEASGAAERANYQMFLSELCDILEVPRPDPTSPDPEHNLYVFDRAITRTHPDGTTATNRSIPPSAPPRSPATSPPASPAWRNHLKTTATTRR